MTLLTAPDIASGTDSQLKHNINVHGSSACFYDAPLSNVSRKLLLASRPQKT